MNTNQIKLILMNYSEGNHVPELGGIYINNIIIPLKSDVFDFIRKYNVNIQFYTYFPNDHDNIRASIRAMRKLVFHMNLLNFNSYSSWRIMLTSIPLPSLTQISPFIQYFNVRSQTDPKYIIYRKI